MQKRLEKVIKKLEKINGDNLIKSDKDAVERLVEVLGENIPSQLKEWYSVYDGGYLGQTLEFYSTKKEHEGFKGELYTFEETNDPNYKKENYIEEDLYAFAVANDGTLIGFDVSEKAETIYIYDIDEGAAIAEYKDLAEFIEDQIQNFYLMDEAFEIHFSKVADNYLTYNNSNPKILYSEKLNKELMLTEPDENGEVEWQPVPVEDEIDLGDIEDELCFSLHGDLPDYYTKFLFLKLDGYVDEKTYLRFSPIQSMDNIYQVIASQFEAAQEVFPNSEMFLLGRATVNGDDNYGIYYNNERDVLFLYNPAKDKKVDLGRLSYTIAMMSA